MLWRLHPAHSQHAAIILTSGFAVKMVNASNGKCLKEFAGNVTGELKQWRRASIATAQAAAQVGSIFSSFEIKRVHSSLLIDP
jgi:microcompartment protein CcmL/EutN